ncbi:hypothetical protein [Agromyces lapidis]|uniref:Integral membrane protein n=1 Tax=Agromyces lapidis TaxID=279574 RepID=A0ABV5SQB9_9MICO|nr:hypothetical protein [Agromyces lapidis]
MQPSATTPATPGAAPAGSDGHEASAAAPSPLPRWPFILIGVAAAVIGLLPWLVTGMRLPLQNLWASDTMPENMPLVLLPFSQYRLSVIASLLVVGAAAAGITARALRGRSPHGGFALLLFGVLLVDVVAIVQTATIVGAGLRDDTWSQIYLTAVLAVAILALLVAVLVLWLIARAPRAGAVIGLAIAAVLVSGWLHLLLAPEPAFAGEPAWLWTAVRWVPAVLVGAAIAWGGVGTIGRVIAALASLAILWIGPALITAVSAAAGTRVLAREPAEMLDYGRRVFELALTDPALVVPPLVVAVCVAGVGLIGRALLGRSSRARSEASDAPTIGA